jgi:hypothetical protein
MAKDIEMVLEEKRKEVGWTYDKLKQHFYNQFQRDHCLQLREALKICLEDLQRMIREKYNLDPEKYSTVIKAKSALSQTVEGDDGWIRVKEYNHAVNEIGQLQEQLKEANEYIRDLQKGYEH